MPGIVIGKAREISEQSGFDIIVIVALGADGNQHVTTYGRRKIDSINAAETGNRLKEALGWPENLLHESPTERICGNCDFYDPDYGIHCFNGWSGDGSKGHCLVEPIKVRRKKEDRACRYFEGRSWRRG